MKIIRWFQEMRVSYIIFCIEFKVDRMALKRSENRGGDNFFAKLLEADRKTAKPLDIEKKIGWNTDERLVYA